MPLGLFCFDLKETLQPFYTCILIYFSLLNLNITYSEHFVVTQGISVFLFFHKVKQSSSH